MPILSDLNISSSGPTFWFFILAIFIILFSLLIYRRTNPVIPKILKHVLVFLRITSLLLLLLVIYETIFEQNLSSSQPPILAVAIDNSASMGITDESGTRSNTVENILQSDWLLSNSNNFDIKYFCFAEEGHPFNSPAAFSLSYVGDQTDITKALTSIKEELAGDNLTDILLLSDGNYNSGINPLRVAESFDIPIHTVGVGSTLPTPDLSLIKVEYNDFTYVKDSTPITVSIRNIGFAKGPVLFNVQVNGELYISEVITIESSPSEAEHTFQYIPTSEGQKKIEINLVSQNLEQTLENNKKTIYINVLKSKLVITTLAGSVSPDLSFLRNALSANERYEFNWAIQNKDGGYYNPQPDNNFINNSDIFILVDFPTFNTLINLLEQVKSKVEKDDTPILLLFGNSIEKQKLSYLQKYLPFSSNYNSVQERSKIAKMSQIGALHSIMNFASGPPNTTNFKLEQLPPLFTKITNVILWPNSETLAYLTNLSGQNKSQNQNTGPPFLSIKVDGTQKSATIFAYGLWRWSLLMANRSTDVDYFSLIIGNLLRWLEPDNSSTGTLLTLNKNKFSLSDKIEAKIKVRDSQNKPIPDVEVLLKVKLNNFEKLEKVVTQNEGSFLSEFFVEQPGDYKIVADVYSNGNLLESTDSHFTVGEYSTELSQTVLQQSLLNEISIKTGGTYFSADSLLPLKDKLYGQNKTLIKTSRLYLWNHTSILAAIIILLVTEWYVRKRLGLI